MHIPLSLLVYLPKSTQEKSIQNRWDDKSNKDIIHAYDDALEWIKLSEGRFSSETMDNIADRCQGRLDEYIMPQIIKRGLIIQ